MPRYWLQRLGGLGPGDTNQILAFHLDVPSNNYYSRQSIILNCGRSPLYWHCISLIQRVLGQGSLLLLPVLIIDIYSYNILFYSSCSILSIINLLLSSFPYPLFSSEVSGLQWRYSPSLQNILQGQKSSVLGAFYISSC